MSKSKDSLLSSSTAITLVLAAGLTSMIVLSGCRGSELNGNATEEEQQPTNPPVGIVDDAAGLYVRMYNNGKYPYFESIEPLAGRTLPQTCKVQKGEANSDLRDIACVINVNELDLAYYGLTFQFNVPRQMCDYLTFSRYYYYGRKPGNGPTTISVTYNQAGTAINQLLVNGTAGNKTTGGIRLSSSGSASVVPFCAYDYTEEDGPNCCEGDYTLSVTKWDAQAGAYGPPETSSASWGGDRRNCRVGPGMDDDYPHFSDGTPMPMIVDAYEDGLNRTYDIKSFVGATGKSVYGANYFENVYNVLNESSYATVPEPALAPYYQVNCLDAAAEEYYRITLPIKEYDFKPSFEARGNPDSGLCSWSSFVGSRLFPNFYNLNCLPEVFPFDFMRVDDRFDWRALGLANTDPAKPTAYRPADATSDFAINVFDGNFPLTPYPGEDKADFSEAKK